MARKSRVHLPGGLFHVMLRGNNRQTIFIDDDDREQFERYTSDGVTRYRHRIHAYCWMPNHVHLAIQCGNEPLSRVVQNLAFRYAAWFNRRYNRCGHVFQGRFKAILVDADDYLLQLVRYIHLNPVRANMCEYPDDYVWSGHRSYLGRTSRPWLRTEWVLSLFGENEGKARERYQRFVWEGRAEKWREEFHRPPSETPLLRDDFAMQLKSECVARRASTPLTPQTVCRIVCDLCAVAPEALISRKNTAELTRIRNVVAYLVVSHQIGSLAELAPVIGRDRTTMSRAVLKIREQSADNAFLALLYKSEAILKNVTSHV
jgi:putative transposase